MSEEHQAGDIVCPPWNEHDHRFVARHYAAYPRKCRVCGCEVAVSRQKKKQADAENLQFICEQCDLRADKNPNPE
jgi:hypothetical protein